MRSRHALALLLDLEGRTCAELDLRLHFGEELTLGLFAGGSDGLEGFGFSHGEVSQKHRLGSILPGSDAPQLRRPKRRLR